MEPLLFLFYLTVFLGMIYYIITEVQEGWSILSVFLIFFTVQYLLIPLLFILNDTVLFLDFSVPDLYISYHGLEYFYSMESFLLVFIFITFLFVGLWSVKERPAKHYQLEERTVNLFGREVSLLFLMGLFLTLLSFVSLFLYASAFGGMGRAIEVAARVRSGYGEEVWLSQKYIFTKRFIPFSILGIIIFFLLQNQRPLMVWIMFYIALGVAVFSRFVLFKGKQNILALVLLYLFYLSIKNKKSYLSYFVLFFLSAVFLIPALESYLDTHKLILPEMSSFAQQILDMFQFFNFDQVSLEFAIQKEYPFFYFEDFVSGIRGSYIPESWLSHIDGNTMVQNTYFFYGLERTIVPPGVMAAGYYNFGVIGVVLMGFFTGVIVKKLDAFFHHHMILNPKLMIVYAFSMTQAFTWVRTGLPKYTFYNTTITVLLFIMILGFRRKLV